MSRSAHSHHQEFVAEREEAGWLDPHDGGTALDVRRKRGNHATGFGLRFIDSSTGLIEGTLLLLLGGRYVVFSSEGHYLPSAQGVEAELVCVVQTEAGQETLSPADFAKRFGWTNDPGQARLVGGSREAATR